MTGTPVLEREGLETIQILHQRRPQLKIIATTGKFGNEFLHMAVTLGSRASLSKPFRPEALIETVKRADWLVCHSLLTRAAPHAGGCDIKVGKHSNPTSAAGISARIQGVLGPRSRLSARGEWLECSQSGLSTMYAQILPFFFEFQQVSTFMSCTPCGFRSGRKEWNLV